MASLTYDPITVLITSDAWGTRTQDYVLADAWPGIKNETIDYAIIEKAGERRDDVASDRKTRVGHQESKTPGHRRHPARQNG